MDWSGVHWAVKFGREKANTSAYRVENETPKVGPSLPDGQERNALVRYALGLASPSLRRAEAN